MLIKVWTLPATDTKGTRVKGMNSNYKTKVIAYDHSVDFPTNYQKMADFLSNGKGSTFMGNFKNTYYYYAQD